MLCMLLQNLHFVRSSSVTHCSSLSHLSGAACNPAVGALSTILAILLVLVVLMAVALLVVCCKLRTLSTGKGSVLCITA